MQMMTGGFRLVFSLDRACLSWVALSGEQKAEIIFAGMLSAVEVEADR